MSAPMRRGACPSLAAPMPTGDGWLARLAVAELTATQLAGLAAAADRLGNGLVEVTARGSLQLRGLTPNSAAVLGDALAGLGVEVAAGLPVLTGALAGLDLDEIADPRPLAAALRQAAEGLVLLPKVSVVVDGGGTLHLDAVPADVRLVAIDPTGRWRVMVADAGIGTHDAAGAVAAARSVLESLAARRVRARDLAMAGERQPPRPAAEPVGRFGPARGLGLPFGQADAAMLAGLAVAAGDARYRPAAGRALLVVGSADDAALVAAARRLGFVLEPDDPRRAVVACSGAPACAAGLLPTRALAGAVAGAGLAGPGWRLHLSGCSKRCAQPAGAAVTMLGTPDGWALTGDGMAVPPGLRSRIEAIAGRAGS